MTTFEQMTSPEHADKHYSLSEPGDYVKIDMTDPAFSETHNITLTYGDGSDSTIEVATLATIEPSDGKQFEVVLTSDDFVGVLTEQENRLVSIGSVGKGKNVEIRDGDERHVADVILADPFANEPDNRVMIRRAYVENDSTVEISVADWRAADRGNQKEDSDLKEHKRKWRKAKKFIAGVALGYGIFHSGGGVDATMDGFNDAHDTVYEATQMVQVGDKIDGFVVKDQESADDFNEGPNGVARTMDDLDGGNYDAIQKRAQEFIELHKGEWLSENQKKELFQSIESAASLNDLEGALDSIEELYKLEFEFAPDDSEFDLNNVKHTVKSVCEGMVNLPRSLVTQTAGLKKIKVHSKDYDSYAKGTSIAGYYSPGRSAITLLAVPRVFDAVVSQGIPGVDGSEGMKSVFLHELGHAINEYGGISAANSSVLMGGRDADATNFDPKEILYMGEDLVMGGLLNYPQSISTYGRSNVDENASENIAGAIDPFRSDALAHPDETRRYQSPANRHVLNALSNLEERLPGIADYLVASNARLMNEK